MVVRKIVVGTRVKFLGQRPPYLELMLRHHDNFHPTIMTTPVPSPIFIPEPCHVHSACVPQAPCSYHDSYITGDIAIS